MSLNWLAQKVHDALVAHTLLKRQAQAVENMLPYGLRQSL